MAAVVAFGPPLLSSSNHLSTSRDTKQVRGAVNLAILRGKSTTIGKRNARHSSSTFVRNEAAGDTLKVTEGAPSRADLEGGDSEEEKATKQSSSVLRRRRELLWAAAGTFSYVTSAELAQSAPALQPTSLQVEVNGVPGTGTRCLPDRGGRVPGALAMDTDAEWINFTARSSGTPRPSRSEVESFMETPKILRKDESTTFLLRRREPNDEEVKEHEDEGLTPDDLEETLLVKGVKVPARSYMSYGVFINFPKADRSTPVDIIEFVGMITNIPQPSRTERRVNFRLSIGATVIGLNIPPLESVSVTFVPQNQQEDAPFDGLETEWN